VYMGDAHAMQGDGEIAGHTCDVSAIVTLQVQVIKGLNLEGPLLLPLEEDLPYLAKPFTKDEKRRAQREADRWNIKELEETAPVSVVGTGANLNEAIDNGLQRAARFFEMSVPEVKNRATITGSVEIGRAPGVATVTFLAPAEKLKEKGLWDLVSAHYQLK
ncbi:MAG: acetamidase/formamidase family protein, partial [Bacillota bacterium]|nr:acetamidase/formamidase family protein [Bacillota bacterium]